MRLHRCAISAGCVLALGIPALAAPEFFGQETVEVRPPKTKPQHSRRHDPGAHLHRHGPAGRSQSHQHRGAGHRPDGRIHAGHTHAPGGAHQHSGHDDAHPSGHQHHGIETEQLFGFTKGTDIDEPGVKHFISDLDLRFTKRTGSYTALSQHLEYAFTPWRDFHVGLGTSFAAHRISGVEGFEDRRQAAFEGLSIDVRQRLLDRAQAPFGLTLIAEPHWARLDEASGQPADKFAVEFTIAADKELIKDRLYGAANLIYEPEWTRLKSTGEVDRGSTLGVSFAAMTPLTASVLVGSEVRYLRKYEGATLNTFAGEALYLGPTLFLNLNDSVFLIAAYSTQLAGHSADSSGSLDLDHFERHRAKLKAVIHF